MNFYSKVASGLFLCLMFSSTELLFAGRPINNNHERAQDAAMDGDYAEALYYYDLVLKTEPNNEVIKSERAEAAKGQKRTREEKRNNQKINTLKNDVLSKFPVCQKLYEDGDYKRAFDCASDLRQIVGEIEQLTGEVYKDVGVMQLWDDARFQAFGIFEWTAKHYLIAIGGYVVAPIVAGHYITRLLRSLRT